MNHSKLLILLAMMLAPGCARTTTAPPEARAFTFNNAAVAADHPVASEAGAQILRQGGNAVDAAVATSFTLSVVRPHACGIGGGGFMVICFNNDPDHGSKRVAINYREVAPGAVGADFYEALDDRQSSRYGAKAVGVPGTVAGLTYALEHYGTMDRATILAPAIRAAESGFTVDQAYLDANRELIEWYHEDSSRQQRFKYVWEHFLKEGAVQVGDRIDMSDQAAALRLIAEQGPRAFYRGEIALEILATMRRHDGVLGAEDLLQYEAAEIEPLTFEAFGHRFVTMPPPSSGGIALAQTMGILERRQASLSKRPNSGAYIHLVAEALKHAFADRARWLGDPAFVDVPVAELTSSTYLNNRAGQIDLMHTRNIEKYGSAPVDDAGTSHFSVVDARGNAVACTETINLEFGSLVAVEKFGFCLNNEMDDFTTGRGEVNAFGLRQSERNLPAPGKRPLSSMTPTIVLNANGKVVLVTGGSGGPRIITATLQVILNVLLFDMPASQAVAAQRFHHQWMPDALRLEPSWFAASEQLVRDLESRGHRVEPDKSKSNVQLIRRNKRAAGWDAACDPRRGGAPAGY